MAEISLDELGARLAALSEGRLRRVLREVLGPATQEVEDHARQNLQSRLTMRSRSLLTSLRGELVEDGADIHGRVSAGGDYGGLQVRYARLQEEGGTIRPVNAKHLAIPIEQGLTGPGIARYDSPRQVPFAAFRPVDGDKARWIVYDKRNDDVFFVLVTDVEVPGTHYLRDALQAVYPGLPGRLLAAVSAGVAGEA